jgi:hypothetical protein
MFKKGDTVKIKKGISLPDMEAFDMTDWQGKIVGFVESDDEKGVYLLEIELDSITLKNMSAEYIQKNIDEGFDFDTMILSKEDVEKAGARDKAIDRINVLKSINAKFLDESEGDDDDEEYWDDDDEMVAEILGARKIGLNVPNLEKYMTYIKKEITFPCILEGIESMGDFGWEEKFQFGYGTKTEYEAIRKKSPSLKDQFELLEFLDKEIADWNTIPVKVKRLSDNKIFELCLDGLKPIDTKSHNYKVIDTFVVWFVNH